jgi:ferredoxin-NADP reductase
MTVRELNNVGYFDTDNLREARRANPWSEIPVVLLSAGVGLTSMISMLNAIVESGSGRPVWFIHGARSGREHAFGRA